VGSGGPGPGTECRGFIDVGHSAGRENGQRTAIVKRWEFDADALANDS